PSAPRWTENAEGVGGRTPGGRFGPGRPPGRRGTRGAVAPQGGGWTASPSGECRFRRGGGRLHPGSPVGPDPSRTPPSRIHRCYTGGAWGGRLRGRGPFLQAQDGPLPLSGRSRRGRGGSLPPPPGGGEGGSDGSGRWVMEGRLERAPS